MVKRTTSRRVDRSLAPQYAETGRGFLAGARALADVADERAAYGNAIALSAIHAAISYSDALCIGYGEKKSADDHTKAVATLRSVLGSRLPDSRAKDLGRILREKDLVSYQGSFYLLEEGVKLLEIAERYCEWAADTLEQRPG